jgi:AcrR family transcriptional regulator
MVQKRNTPAPRVKPAAKKTRPLPAAATPVVTKVEPRGRGRPPAYEPEVALARALDVFWKEGFAGTSLDDLSAATGMNRPSLYGAFGDKRELYIKSYEAYRDRARTRMGEVFGIDMPLRPMLERIYSIALDMYLSGKDGPRGCFTVMTATSEAVFDPAIREMVISGLVETDRFFGRIFKRAQERGELPASADPQVLAQLASATLHTIAIRSRARVSRAELDGIVKGALDVMCGK